MKKENLIKSIKDEMCDVWQNHPKNLAVHSDMLRIALFERADHLWKSFIFNMPKGVMRFMMNAFKQILM